MISPVHPTFLKTEKSALSPSILPPKMFDPGTNLPNNHAILSDRMGRVNDSYDGYRSWKSFGDGDDHDSPPLWRTSPTASPQHRKNHYRSLSPSSRTQAIARGQRELMDMVSRMPESCYELSLKDLVEQPMLEVKQESFREAKPDNKGVLKKNENKVQMMKRSGSLDNERFLLKMVFPVTLGSKKNTKKKNEPLGSNNNNTSKITPKSPVCDGSDKEWWKKRLSDGSSSNSASAKSSASSSSSSSRSSSRQGSGGCWSFMRTKISKKAE